MFTTTTNSSILSHQTFTFPSKSLCYVTHMFCIKQTKMPAQNVKMSAVVRGRKNGENGKRHRKEDGSKETQRRDRREVGKKGR